MALNHLLNSLSPQDLKDLEQNLETVDVQRHQELIVPDRLIPYVYFPETCMISLVTILENGTQIEAATVGNEGVVGLSVFLGLDQVNMRAICQMPGEALRMRRDDFKKAFSASQGLRIGLGLYAHALIAMLAQANACNASHPSRHAWHAGS
jgi:hypothetical protein